MFHGGFFDFSQGKASSKVIEHDVLRVSLVLAGIAAASSFMRIEAVAAFAVLAALLIGRAGMPIRVVLLRLLLTLPFGLGAVFLLLWRQPETGLAKGLLLMTKLVTANLGVTFLLGTTSIPVLLKTLRTLRVPGPLVDMIGFTLRYLSVLGEEIQAMIVAQKSRGLNTGSFASIRSYKRSGQLLGVLLIRSMERSVRIHQAMLSRGYDTSSGSRKRGKADVRHRSERPVVPVPGYDRGAEKRFV